MIYLIVLPVLLARMEKKEVISMAGYCNKYAEGVVDDNEGQNGLRVRNKERKRIPVRTAIDMKFGEVRGGEGSLR